MSRYILFAALLCALGLAGAATTFAAEAEQIFKFYCAQCQGLSGKGDGPNVTKKFPVSPRNFISAAEMNKLSDADLKNVILDGGPAASKSPMMPPWGKTLSEAEVDALGQDPAQALQMQGEAGMTRRTKGEVRYLEYEIVKDKANYDRVYEQSYKNKTIEDVFLGKLHG